MASWLRRCWRHFILWLGLSAIAPALQAIGPGFEFRYSEIVPVEQQYIVNTAVNMAPNPRVQELVEAGIAVPFVAEFLLTRPRWYWFEEVILERSLDLRLSYHALTRQYRVSVGSLHRNFLSYEEALRALLTIRNWAVLDRNQLREGQSYNVALRFRLDLGQLPKPFQVAALGSRDLDLSTGWVNWTFLATSRDPK